MCAFNLGDVEEARGVTNESTAGKGAARDRLEAAFVEGTRTVGDAATAGEGRGKEGVVLHALEFAIWGEVRVGVVLQGSGSGGLREEEKGAYKSDNESK